MGHTNQLEVCAKFSWILFITVGLFVLAMALVGNNEHTTTKDAITRFIISLHVCLLNTTLLCTETIVQCVKETRMCVALSAVCETNMIPTAMQGVSQFCIH